jgi:4-amino-4-deoxy-L-arabinose transferase-like glycosyltransferase
LEYDAAVAEPRPASQRSQHSWYFWRERLLEWVRLAPAWQLSALVFGVAALVRLVYLLEIKDLEIAQLLVGDGEVYDAWASRIRDNFVGTDVFYQAPLYPYFLALTYGFLGHAVFAARVVQALLGAAGCALLAAAGGRFFSRGRGLLAGLGLAVYAPAVFFDGIIHKAVLDLFLTSALLYGLARIETETPRRPWVWPLLAGLTLGALVLTRENAAVLLPLLGLWLAWRVGRRPAVVFALGTVLALAPVAARNYAVGGELVVTTSQFGANFFIGNNAAADGTYTPLRWGHSDLASERADAIELAEQAAGRALTAKEVSRYWSGRAWDWIGAHPGAWVRLTGRKWLLLWNHHEISDSDEYLVYRDAAPVLGALAWLFSFATLCPLAAVGLVSTWSRRRELGSLYAVILGVAGSAALFFVFARYRLAMVPALVVFAVVGADALVTLARQRQRRRLAALAGLVVVTFALGHLALFDEGPPRAMAYYNLAVAEEAAGDTARAAANYRRSLTADPDFVQAHVNLGGLLARGGQLEEAVVQEQAALRARPDDGLAHVDLANALYELGRLDEAEPHYRAALHADPELTAAQDGLRALEEARRQRAP